jgi:hypothetical protein
LLPGLFRCARCGKKLRVRYGQTYRYECVGAFNQLAAAANGMLGDALEHISQPGLRVDIVEFRCADQGIDGGSALTAAIRRDLIMPGAWDAR